MSSPVLLDGPKIRRLLEEVAGELEPSGPQHTVVVVGGSLLSLWAMSPASLSSVFDLDRRRGRRLRLGSHLTGDGDDGGWRPAERIPPTLPCIIASRCVML